jgi:uncharacterized protein YndB with AHSA1/START domain
MQALLLSAPTRLRRRQYSEPSQILRAKAKWFVGPDEWNQIAPELDFRVGGKERVGGGPKGGRSTSSMLTIMMTSSLNQRIVYNYDMHFDDKRMSVSLATIEFKPAGNGTKLIFTEQGVFLNGYDNPAEREEGTHGLLDRLEVALRDE